MYLGIMRLLSLRTGHPDDSLQVSYIDPIYGFVKTVILGNFSSERHDEVYRRTEDNIYLETSDGQRIGAYLVKPHRFNDKTLFFVLCHGKGSDRHSATKLGNLRELSRHNVCFLVIDYRGFGDSTGEFTMAGVNLDLDAAFRYIRRKYNPSSIFMVGHSMGAAIALEYCRYLKQKHEILPTKVFCLAIFSTLVDACREFLLYRIARFVFPHIEKKLMMEINYDNIKNAKEIREKLLLVHGENDELIPIFHSKRVAQESGVRMNVTHHSHDGIMSDKKVWMSIFDLCHSPQKE